MTDKEIADLPDHEKAAVIRRAFQSRDGKKALQIIKIHFSCHLPSASVAEFDTNRTFYQSGVSTVPSFIDQILEGMWSEIPQQEEQEPENELS